MIIKKSPEKFRGLFCLFIRSSNGKACDIMLMLLIKAFIKALIKALIDSLI